MKMDLAEKMDHIVPEKPYEGPYYPSIHISRDKKIELPDSGEMTVKFKVRSREESERDGKERYSCQIEIQEITGVSADECCSEEKSGAKNKMDEAGDALDAIRAALSEGEKD